MNQHFKQHQAAKAGRTTGKRFKSIRFAIRTSTKIGDGQGFSLVYVLIAALALIGGTATLISRTGSGVSGSVFQEQSLEARDAAKAGMAYLISQINKESNRLLLAVRKEREDVDQEMWTDTSASAFHRNTRCLATPNPAGGAKLPAPIPSIAGVPFDELRKAEGKYFYIQPNGSITTNKENAQKAFRIVPPGKGGVFRLAHQDKLEHLRETKAGLFSITIEGIIFTKDGNKVQSSVVLQEDFDVTLKCCRTPISKSGSVGDEDGHGSFRLETKDRSNITCLGSNISADSFGIVVGVSGENGFLNATGAKGVIRDRNGNKIEPILCISSSETECSSSQNTSNNKPFERLDVELPPPPQYPANIAEPLAELSNCETTCTSNKDPSQVLEANKQLVYRIGSGSGSTTVMNALNVAASNLPNNCILDSKDDLHCAFSRLNVANNRNFTFITGETSRRIRLYFPIGGPILSTGGPNVQINHCKNAICGSTLNANKTDLSLFGCSIQRGDPGCSTQTLDWQGSTDATGMALFLYAPEAELTMKGSVTLGGVLWVRGIDIQGDSYPFVPASGVGDAFVLMGILPGEDNTFKDSINGKQAETDILPMDMVARSSKRFRFFGN